MIPFLQQNDKVVLIAPAGAVNSEKLLPAIHLLNNWGLKVNEGTYLHESHGQFAGTDQQRLHDLQNALDNTEIKAVFCVRGGYGISRIIDHIDFTQFSTSPKWLVGFSDITHLHLKLQQLGFESVHAIMPIFFGAKGAKKACLKLKYLLFGKIPEYHISSHADNQIGKITAKLIGGNLSILIDSLSTNNQPDYKGAILLIEEVGEYHYELDRMMTHLKRVGVLSAISGLIVGKMTRMKKHRQNFGANIHEIILQAVSPNKYPVLFDFPVGHQLHNMPLVMGRNCTLHINGQKSIVTFE